jgi:hypothetical protein
MHPMFVKLFLKAASMRDLADSPRVSSLMQGDGQVPAPSAIAAKARELVAVARRCGYRPAELAEIIEQVSMELP